MKRHVDALGAGTFDLLVVGGGVYGAWTAYDASLRGLRVAIVEQGDWASGTSSMSSKLIHGGLRYLEYHKFGLVRKALRERNRLRQLAPHRVQRLRFAIPLYGVGWRMRLKLRLGLILYDMIARAQRPLHGHESLSRQRMKQKYDFIKRDRLEGGFTYGDCQTDDARFTLELIDGALHAGTIAINHASVLRLTEDRGAIVGAVVEDRLEGTTIQIKAKFTALCAGAWNQTLLEAAVPGSTLKTRFSKGVHLVMPALPTSDAFLLLTGERGRVVFLIPWNGRTLLGTTDTPFEGDPRNARCLAADETYLLDHANAVLKDVQWTENDVIGRYTGLRTFMDKAGDPSSLAREWSLAKPYGGVVASVGGKYTSARVDAAKLVDHVCNELGRDPGPCPTAQRPFPWRPEGRYRSWQQRTLDQSLRLGLDEETALACQLRYGRRFEVLLRMIEKMPRLARRFVPETPMCIGELVFCSRYEMVANLQDLLRRRLPLTLIATLPEQRVRLAAAVAGKILRWSNERQIAEVRSICGEISGP